MANDLVFLDTETTGLDPRIHEVWEIAWAVNDGPVQTIQVGHTLTSADPQALKINGYLDRWQPLSETSREDEDALREALDGATLVCSNPAFDEAFLRRRWGNPNWHHRKIDIATYAMPALGADRPVGLAAIAERLGVRAPDHTARVDVLVLRACHRKLTKWYGQRGVRMEATS